MQGRLFTWQRIVLEKREYELQKHASGVERLPILILTGKS